MPDKTRLLLVDDQQLFVENLRIVIESRTKDMKVVGVAANGEEAVEMVGALQPSIVLMDVRMPKMDGVAATKIIRVKHPDVRVVMLTTFDDDEYAFNALREGAVGYLLKNIPPAELLTSLRAIREGSVLMAPSVAFKLVRAHDQNTSYGAPERISFLKSRIESLTPRERDILHLISLAYDNQEIAKKLQIAEQTVKNYISIIYSKMDVSKRTQLMQVYQEHQRISGKGT